MLLHLPALLFRIDALALRCSGGSRCPPSLGCVQTTTNQVRQLLSGTLNVPQLLSMDTTVHDDKSSIGDAVANSNAEGLSLRLGQCLTALHVPAKGNSRMGRVDVLPTRSARQGCLNLEFTSGNQQSILYLQIFGSHIVLLLEYT